MLVRIALCCAVAALLTGPLCAQQSDQLGWRAAGRGSGSSVAPASLTPQGADSASLLTNTSRSVRVTKGSGTLPNDHGQVWREYDIGPYTKRVDTVEHAEQAIVDWILRETGTEAWFSEPVGLLSAGRETLRVYHTPQMQQIVADVVERFVASENESQVLGIRLVSVANPNWRTKALPHMRSVSVQTPGIEAWLMTKESAAILQAEMAKRTDFREHGSPDLLIHNGQSHTISNVHQQPYVRGVQMRNDVLAGYQPETGVIEQGYQLLLSPLLSTDRRTIDVVIKCRVDQIERINTLKVDVPTTANPRQQVEVQVPQVSSWSLHERFRWPADQVLLISRGMVAIPAGGRPTTVGLGSFFGVNPKRADALLFLESKGAASRALAVGGQNIRTGAANYHGRY